MLKTLHNILVRLEQLCKAQHWLLHALYAPFRPLLLSLPTTVRGANPNTWFILIYTALVTKLTSLFFSQLLQLFPNRRPTQTRTVAHFLHTPARLGLGPSAHISELGRALEQRAEQLVRSPVLNHSGLFVTLDKLTSGAAPAQGTLPKLGNVFWLRWWWVLYSRETGRQVDRLTG